MASNRKKRRRKKVITMTPEVYRLYRESVGSQKPETFALLGGKLDNPFHISEFRCCPPRKNRHGRYDAGPSHVNVDHEYMNWVIDNIWVPNEKYMLGIWHSHPAGCISPSYGDRGRNEGDVVFFSACLNADDSPDRNWKFFLAPITTFDNKGKDLIHGWFLPKGSDRPVKAEVRIPRSEISLQETVRVLRQCPYSEIKQQFHSASLTKKQQHKLICLLRLVDRRDVVEHLCCEHAEQKAIDLTV